MKKINEELIDQLAHLARLEFHQEEKQKILNDLNRILDYIDTLNELDTDHVEPLVYLSPNQNILREDKVIETMKKEKALNNAPKKDSDYFRVPKVISQ
ncbi:MAG: Asp-tRNA(Asn)/Glu-tRNA(Gln) amidotransferase subunit GatC [Bacteroidetes bacterium]|jgi:aspartyl-tRNA(Asn)/glutamyl-tRNA(Gln) amidotransferase subunit C|nr:MAG: Asp-tRNA(Asn)/Glu-tRNA(Gln) amidotransferase subunit GatC [Bacteroidota bacterium]